MPPSHSSARNARPPIRSTRATSASGASARWRSPTRRGDADPDGAPAPDPGRAAHSGATPTSCRSRRAASGCRTGFTPLLKADRLAEQLGLGELYVKNDAANPTHSFKDRVVSVALSAARELGFEDDRLRLHRQPGQRRRRARRRAPACESYVFIPADLEQEKILATGVYGANLVAVQGNYDDVNRLCTESAGEHPWAFVNVNMRPYYAEGSKTLALRDGRAARLGAARPRRRPDRLRLAVHEDRARLPGVDRPGLLRASCPPCAAPRRPAARRSRTAFAAGTDVCRPVKPDTIAKSLAIGNPADGPYARRAGQPHRRRRSTPSPTTRSARASGCWPRRPASSPRPPAASPSPCWPSSPQRATIDPDERVVVYITGEGLKTLDVVRGTFEGPRSRRRSTSSRPPSAHGRGGADGSHGQDPDAARPRRGGAPRRRSRAPPSPRCSTRCTTARRAHGRIAEDGAGLRRFVNVYLGGEDIRFLDGLDTPVDDGAEVTILPAVAGG